MTNLFPPQTRLLLFIVTVSVVLMSLPYVAGASLWTDEFGTFWVVGGTLHDAVQRTFDVQGQTPLYYVLLWGWVQLFGLSELSLRLPSLACVMVLPWLVVLLHRELLACTVRGGEQDVTSADLFPGVLASIFATMNDRILMVSLSARPYSCAILCAVASLWCFTRGLRIGGARYWIASLLLAICTVYFHYLFASLFVLIGCFWILLRGRPQKPWFGVAGMGGFFLVALLSLLVWYPAIVAIDGNSTARAYLPLPGMSELWPSLVSRHFIISTFSIIAVGTLVNWSLRVLSGCFSSRFSKLYLAAAILVATVPPIVIYGLSHLRGESLFDPRYFALSSLGAALVIGWLASGWTGNLRAHVSLFLVTLLLGATVQIKVFVAGQREDWREGTKVHSDTPCLTLIFSGFVEAQDTEWLLDRYLRSLFLSPLTYYRPEESGIPIPYSFSPSSAERYLQEDLAPLIEKARCVHVISRSYKIYPRGREEVSAWEFLGEYLPSRGFSRVSSRTQGAVWSATFARAGYALKVTDQHEISHGAYPP